MKPVSKLQIDSPANNEVPQKEILRLDLTTEVIAPIKLNGLQIGPKELIALAEKIDQYLKLKRKPTEEVQTLEFISSQLMTGDLGVFTRELRPQGLLPKDQHLITLAEETFGIGSFPNLATQLAQIPDYETQLLSADPEFLNSVALELKRLNLEYCTKRLPHFIAQGGIPLFTLLANCLEANNLKHTIAIRLNEGDKMRNRGELSEYIQKIFGTGFRLSKDYYAKYPN